MVTIRIYDLNDHVLAFDLREILATLGPLADTAEWGIGDVVSSDEALSATGEGASRLAACAATGERVPGTILAQMANTVRQVIWGDFRAYADRSTSEPSMVIRAIDSSFYEVSATDPGVIRHLQSAFKDVRTM